MVSKDLLSAGGAMWSSESTIIAQGEEVPVFVSLRVFIVIMVFIWFRKVENEIKDCESAKVVFMSNLSRRLYWYSDEHVYGIERGWNGMDMIGLLQYLSSKCEWKKGRSHQCHHGPHKLIQVGQKQDMMGYQISDDGLASPNRIALGSLLLMRTVRKRWKSKSKINVRWDIGSVWFFATGQSCEYIHI